MNKSIKIFFLLLAGISIFLIFYYFGQKFAFPDTNWKLEKGERVKITPGQPLLQKFRAAEDNLKRIDILFGSTDVRPGGDILLKLYNENCADEIRSDVIKVDTLESDKSYDMVFSKIPDSGGKVYCLSVDFKPIDENERKANIFLNDNSSQDNISFMDSSNGQEIFGKSLAIRPAYQEDTWLKNIERLNQRISQYKAFFLKENYLYFIAFGFIVLSILVVVMLIFI